MSEKSVRCVCGGGEHYLHFHTFDVDGEEDAQIYIDMLAKQKLPLLNRIIEACKILLGCEVCYDGIILDKEKSDEICEFLNNFWKRQEVLNEQNKTS